MSTGTARPLREELLSLLAGTTSDFIVRPAAEIDATIDHALDMVGRMFGVDRSYVFLFDREGETMSNSHEWCAPDVSPQREGLLPRADRVADRDLLDAREHGDVAGLHEVGLAQREALVDLDPRDLERARRQIVRIKK